MALYHKFAPGEGVTDSTESWRQKNRTVQHSVSLHRTKEMRESNLFHKILHSIKSLQRRHTRGKGRIMPNLLHSRRLSIPPNAPTSILSVPDKLLNNDVLGNILLLCRLLLLLGGSNVLRGLGRQLERRGVDLCH